MSSHAWADDRALIAITLDLEMSAEYPRRGITEWNFQKGNLDDATKKYAVEAAKYLINQGMDLDLETGLKLERRVAFSMGSPAERKVAIERAMAKAPDWEPPEDYFHHSKDQIRALLFIADFYPKNQLPPLR